MDTIHVDLGDIRLSVNNDDSRAFTFNPRDILFAERFYRLVGNFQKQFAEYLKEASVIEQVADVDENGIPVNVQDRLDLIKNTCNYAREQIDGLFGEGTSQIVFGDALSLEAVAQFFDQIAPYVQSAREEKIKKYIPKPAKKPRKRGK